MVINNYAIEFAVKLVNRILWFKLLCIYYYTYIHTVCGEIYDINLYWKTYARGIIYQNFSSPNKYYARYTHNRHNTIYRHNAMHNIILYNVIIKTLRTESKTFNIAKVKQFHFTLYNLFFMRLLNFRYFFFLIYL